VIYSPTVFQAYHTNHRWFRKYANGQVVDPEGYTERGYNTDGIDRAGNSIADYSYPDNIGKWMRTYTSWKFDGIKPICQNSVDVSP